MSWTDQMVLATVVSSSPATAPTGLDADGSDDGLVSRTVRFQVDRDVWAREGAASLPQTFDSTAWGWVVTDGQPVSIRPEGEVAFEVDNQYLLSVARDGEEWLALGQASLAASETGQLTAEPSGASPFVSSLDGKSIDGAAQVLESAEPLDGLAQFIELPLRERIRSYGKFLAQSETD